MFTNSNKCVLLTVVMVLLVGSPAAITTAGTITITDNFDTSHNYLTGGVAGTIWDGVMNGNYAQAMDANVTSTGQLTLASLDNSSTKIGWEKSLATGLLLYKSVSGDFTAQVKVTDVVNAIYDGGMLMVYKDDSNFVMLQVMNFGSRRYRTRLAIVESGSETAGPESANYNNPPVYLKLMYTSATSTFNAWTSSDGTNWSVRPWIGGDDHLVHSAMTGTLRVGLAFGSYSPNSTNRWAKFDDFSLTVIPEPGTGVLVATGLIGLLAYAWRRKRR